MRKLIIFIPVLATILSSCTGILAPNKLEDPEIKKWVYLHSKSFSLRDELHSFMLDPQWETVDVGGDIPDDLSAAVIVYFYECAGRMREPFPSSYDDYLQQLGEPDFDFSGFSYLWETFEDVWGHNRNYYQSILQANKREAKRLYRILVDEFYLSVERSALHSVSVLNWSLDDDTIAGAYTRYFVEYEIRNFDDEGEEDYSYVLLSLIEFEKSGRCEVKIIYDGKSLDKLHDYYE